MPKTNKASFMCPLLAQACHFVVRYVKIYIDIDIYIYIYIYISISLFVGQSFAIVTLKKMQTLKIIIKCLQIYYFSGHATKS